MFHRIKTLVTAFSVLSALLLGSIRYSFAQTCTGSLGDPVVNITFGTGTGYTTLPTSATGASTTYTQQTNSCPNDGNYTVTNSTFSCFSNSWFDAAEDHTPGDVNGRMAIYNASYTIGEFYRQTISGLCGNTTYEFAGWIANLLRPSACSGGGIDPNLTFRIESLSGTLLGTYSTGNIPESSSLTWKQYGFVFTTPASQTQVVLKIINNAAGGCGNDLLLDDITFRPCGPTISVSASTPSICEGGNINLSGSISPGYNNPQFQWQQSSDNGSTWTNITGATSLNTSVSSAPAGTRYRLLAAEQGNISIGYCRIASNPVALTVYAIPKVTLPTASGTPLQYCAGTSVDLTDFTSTPASTFSWQLNNTAIGLSSGSGTGQVPVFTATNATNSPITGTFTVTGSANGCTSQAQTFSVVINPKPSVNLGADQAICSGGSATITAAASGGTPNYSYSWSNGANNSTSQTVSPSSTTIYTVTVTDTKGCTATDDIKITVNALPNITSLTKTDAICFGQANGTITVTATGTSPLQYQLNNGAFQSQNVFNAVAAGTYNVTVKDGNGCTTTKNINVNQPNPMTASVTVKNVSCFDGTDGAITVDVNGGTSPYSYTWSDGSTGGSSIVGRPAGNYTVTVTDGKGCTTTATATITQPIQISITANLTHVTCNGGTNGKVDITATSVTSIKSYEWKNSGGTIIATTEDVANLAAGTYTVTVTDNDNCKVSASYTITQPTAISATATPTITTCFGGNDGKISITASGGTGGLVYALCSGSNCTSFGATQTSNQFSGLTAGTYRVRVTDTNGCTTTTSDIVVGQAAQLTASASNTSPACVGGSVILSAANAGAGVNYEWKNASGAIVATTQQFTLSNVQLAQAGTYTLRVYNANNCQNTTTTLVKVNPTPDVNAGADQTICEGTTVTLNATTVGGTTPYTYNWDNGLGTGAAKTVSPTTTTSYIVSLSDANGCADRDTIKITVIPKPQLFTLTAPSDLTICAGVNGIPLTLSGSQTGVLYELVRNTVNIGQGKMGTGSALPMGNYFGGTYQVKASTTTNPACSVMMNGSITVNELPPISGELQALDITICPGEYMSYTAVASGGSGTGYTYTWQDGQTGNPRSFTTNDYLLVEVVITDSRGCTLKRAADLRIAPPITVNLSATPTPICAGQPVTLTASATGGASTLLYEWENGSTATTRTVNPTTTTTYSIKVTDSREGCVEQKNTTVTVFPQPQLYNVTGGGAYCAGSPGLSVGLSGSETGFLYQLKRNGQNVGTAVAGTGAALNFGPQTPTGNYTVEASSTTSPVCAATMNGNVVISIKTKPEISASVAPNPVCAGQSVSFTTTPTVANATYAWMGPNGFTSTDQNPAIASSTTSNTGTYTVIATTAEGCSDTAAVSLTVNPSPIASITGPSNLCINNAITLNGNPNGGTTPYTHTWQVTSGASLLTLTNNNNGTANITPTGTGVATISYRVTDANGCQSPVVTYSLGINAALPTATVSAGAPANFTSLVGVRYRSFGLPSEKELYLGIPDLGIAPPRRTQTDASWRSGNNDVTFEYDPATDVLKATVINSAGTFTLTYPNVAAAINTYRSGQNSCAMNVMQLVVGSQNEPTGSVAFANVVLNGNAVGNFSGAGLTSWTIRNVDFGMGFKLSGTVVLTGTQPTSAESNKVEILVGNDQTPLVFGCMSANEVCEGQKSTVAFSGLRLNTTFNLKYSIGTTSNLTASVTTDAQGNASFQTAALTLSQNGATLRIDSVQRAVSSACFLPITSNNTTVLAVNPNPVVSITTTNNSGIANNDAILCEGASTTLTASGGGTYLWNTGASTSSITVSPATSTSYSVTVTSNKGCQTVKNQLITVYPKPQPTAVNSGPVCTGEKITFNASGGTAYQWTNAANSVVSAAASFSFDPATLAQSGIYTVKVTDVNGCFQTATTEAVIKDRPIAQATSNSPKCAGQTLILSAADAGTGATYAWSGPNGFSRPNEQNPIITLAQPQHSGTYLLTVTRNGCSSTTTVDVTIYENPVANALTNSPVCEDSPLNFTAQNAGTGAQYQWKNSAGTVLSTSASFSIAKAALTDAGKYFLTVTKNNCVSGDTVEVIVKPLPNITVQANTPLCSGQTLQFTSVTSPAATKYEWAGPNSFTSPDQHPKIENVTTNATGIYEVIASLNGCRDTSRISVTVNPTPIAVASASLPVCEGGTITLTAANAGSLAQYEWTNAAGTVVSSNSSFALTNVGVADAGVYRLKVTLGACTNEDTAVVVIYPKPKLTIVGTSCAPNLKSYRVDVTVEGGILASSAGIITPTGTNAYTISNVLPSVNPLSVSVTSDKGCSVSQNVTAPNCSCPMVNAPSSGGNKKICQDETIPTLSANVGSNETVDWYETSTGGTPIVQGSETFTPTSAGIYYAQTRNLIHDCVSSTRTPVSLTIVSLPKLVIDSTVCSTDLSNFVVWLTTELSGVTVSSSEGTAVNFTNGRYEIIGASPFGTPNITITVTNVDGCKTQVILKKPDCLCPDLDAPVNAGDKEVCFEQANPSLEATVNANETVDWYDAPTGGNKLATGILQYTPTQIAVGTHTFYAETRRTDITVRTCVSNSRTAIKLTIKALPIVAATSNSAVCEGSDLQLTTAANANTTYLWSGPNGFGASTRSPLRTNAQPSMSGKYIVTVTADGCTVQDSTTVLVKPLPIANTTGVIVCESSPFVLRTPTVLGATYEWLSPTNQVVSIDSLYSVTQASLSQTGTYRVKVTLDGCVQQDTARVTVTPLPLTQALSNAPICAGDTLFLSAANAGSGASYAWQKLATGTVVGNQRLFNIPNAQPNDSGKYVLTVSQNGCENKDTIEVLVKPLPTFAISSNSPICHSDTIKLFTNATPIGATFEWSGPNEYVSFQQNPIITPARPNLSGLYQVTVKVNGCVKTDTLTYTVFPLPVANAISNSPICENDTLRLTAQNAGIGATYEWRKLGGNVISTQTTFTQPLAQLADAGKYLLKVSLNGCVNYDTIDVLVKKRPVFTLSSNSPICEGDSLRLFVQGAPQGTTFAWSGPKQFLAIDSAVVRSNASLDMSGVYLMTTTLGSCSVTDSIRVTVKARPSVNALSNSPVCEGQQLQLTTTAVNNASYTWQDPNGVTIGTSPQVTINGMQPQQSGKYTVTVTLDGCVANDTVAVTIKPKPSFTVDSVVCAPSLKVYTIYGKTNGTVASPLGTLLQLSDGRFTISELSVGTNTSLVFSKNSCDTTFTVSSPVCPCPTVAIAVTPISQTICDGDTLQTIHALVSAGVTADWYDAPTGGNLIASGTLTFKPSMAGKVYAEARAEISGCLSNSRASAEVIIHPTPSFTAQTISTSCDGLDARKDGQLIIKEITNGLRYDFSVGSTYTGNKTFATAQAIPTDGVLADTLSNPMTPRTYTVRVFDATGCYADRVAVLARRDCVCPAPPFVVPESQSVCDNDTLRTIRGFVEPGITVDWYDEQGNLLKKGSIFFKPTKAGIYYAEARDTLSGCKGLGRVPSYAFINPMPSFDLVVTRGTCDGTDVRPDAKITLVDVKNGKRYDYTKGTVYTGNKTYDNATDIPADGIALKNLANPPATEFYSFRVFDSTGCYTDSTVAFEPRICECPKPPFVVPESQAVCEGDTLRTVQGFVDSGVTVDWYDAPTGGNLLLRGSIFFKPTQSGTYYAEARDTLTNCKGLVRAPSYAFVNELPLFDLDAQKASCKDFVAQNDAKIVLKNLKNGNRFDFSVGSVYVGKRTYNDAFDIPADSILVQNIANPATSQTFTIRIFGEPNCFTDKTVTIQRTDCGCNPPSFDLVVTRGTCDGTDVRPDAKITIVDLKRAKRYDFAKAKTYTGNKTYDNATDIPADGVFLSNLPNPATTEFYTVRLFDSTGCYTDSTVAFEPRICECPKPVFVVPESQAVCEGDTLRTVTGFVDSGVTVDWYDAPTGGNLLLRGSILFKPTQAGIYYAEARDTLTNCKSTSRAPSYAFINDLPSFDLVVTRGTCDGTEVRPDAKITIVDVKNGKRYDFAKAKTYTGNKTYDNATAIPADGIALKNLANPSATEFYTFRVFDSTGCYTDSTVAFEPRICECPKPVFVVPESQAVCEGDTLRTVTGFVDSGVTVDWYDAPTGGNLLLRGSILFKPTQAGIYYAEARDTLTNCKSTSRAPSYAFINDLPSFDLVVTRGTCDGTDVRPDAKITIVDVKNGKRYDFTKAKTYTGNKTYDNATDIPADGIALKNLANPSATEFYTFRVFDSTGCYTDSTVAFEPRICECPKPVFVVPESQAVCEGDTLRTVTGFVDSGVTVDWYDAPTGGNLLLRGSILFKPTQAGIYYAEARDTLTNCKSTSRAPSYAFINDLPSFQVTTNRSTCSNSAAQNNGKISMSRLKNGTKYDFSVGTSYTGNRTFDTALDIPRDSILVRDIPNPVSSQSYTIRIFGEPNCFTDTTVTITNVDCNCNPSAVSVVPSSFTICEGEPFPILVGAVGTDITVDWYDKDGNLLKANSLTYQPNFFGEFYAEGRSLVVAGCVSSTRTKAVGAKIGQPTFTLTTRPATCIGDTVLSDGQIIIENLKDGERFDYSLGTSYRGGATYETAQPLPTDGIIGALSNVNQYYTVRIFNRCGLFYDVTIQTTHNDCSCDKQNCLPLQMKMKKKGK
ncbi:MAG: hypothetical protein LCH91_17350 [Bacteroidetes bacterium]|nr:hypothetical protein [Bacteroidota bacterium]